MPGQTEPLAPAESVVLSWSGGKDSCLALRELQRTPGIRVDSLVTTVTRDFDRISMHGVRRVLLERQAASLGLPLHQVEISKSATNQEYETAMGNAFDVFHDVTLVARRAVFVEVESNDGVTVGVAHEEHPSIQ